MRIMLEYYDGPPDALEERVRVMDDVLSVFQTAQRLIVSRDNAWAFEFCIPLDRVISYKVELSDRERR
jgi:hypothetical protein